MNETREQLCLGIKVEGQGSYGGRRLYTKTESMGRTVSNASMSVAYSSHSENLGETSSDVTFHLRTDLSRTCIHNRHLVLTPPTRLRPTLI